LSPKLPVVTSREVTRVAQRAGFELHRQKGSHAVFFRAADGARVVIPMHPGQDIKPKTLVAIIEDMGLTQDEFRDML
jgi:predicted RNA binding protein YcfA (HicA-like mRNA interferase family)